MLPVDFFGHAGNAGHRHFPFKGVLLQFEIRIGLQDLPAKCQEILTILGFRTASSGLVLEPPAKLLPFVVRSSPRTEIQHVATAKVLSP
jgi:hypothetical protein